MLPLVLDNNIISLSLPSSSAMEQQILSCDASTSDEKINVQNSRCFVEDVDYEASCDQGDLCCIIL